MLLQEVEYHNSPKRKKFKKKLGESGAGGQNFEIEGTIHALLEHVNRDVDGAKPDWLHIAECILEKR